MSNRDKLVLSWHDLNLRVPPLHNQNDKEGESRYVLNDLNGYTKSGTLLAIMGPSGCGKTTLLAAVSKRISDGVYGRILLNGKPVDKDLMLRISGFMPQKDLAVETLSVKEHLEFMAILKMDIRVLPEQREIKLETILYELGLNDSKDTLLHNLSGGERKRLALAVQMITDPPLLFCDEPTSGLDSYSAGTVVNVLKKLTKRGKAVVCSIHQPSSDVFMLFDQLCLLLPGGHLAYHGDLERVKDHFQGNGFYFPPSYNPADFILQILNPPNLQESIKRINAFNRSVEKIAMKKELDAVLDMAYDNQVDLYLGIEKRFLRYYSVKHASFLRQVKLLVWRMGISMYRNLHQNMWRFLLYIFTGLLVSMPYIGLKMDQEGIQNLQGFHYAVISETIFCQSYSVMYTFQAEIPILLRELGNGVYSPWSYYLSKVLVVVPRVVLETLVFCTVCFCVVGGTSDFIVFSLPVIASAITSSAYGCFISALFKNISTASLLSVPVDFLSYAFSGLFLQLRTVPIYLRWVKYISRFYYGIEAISILQWQKVDYISCSENEDIPCISTGEGVLDKYGFSQSNLRLDFIAMFIGFLILHILGFLSLWRRSKQQSIY